MKKTSPRIRKLERAIATEQQLVRVAKARLKVLAKDMAALESERSFTLIALANAERSLFDLQAVLKVQRKTPYKEVL